MEEVRTDEDKPSDSNDTDTGGDNAVSDSGTSVEDKPEDVLSDESSDTEQSKTEQSEQSGESSSGGSQGEEPGETEEPETEESAESGTGESGTEDSTEEPGTEGSTEESTESGTEEGTTEESTESGTEEGTEEQTDTGTGDNREAGAVEQEGGIYTGSLAEYLAEQGYTDTGEVAACMEVIHQDNLQLHKDLQLIAVYLTGFVVLTMFYVMYKLLRIFI